MPATLPMMIAARRPELKALVWVWDFDVEFPSEFAGDSMVTISSCAPRTQLHWEIEKLRRS